MQRDGVSFSEGNAFFPSFVGNPFRRNQTADLTDPHAVVDESLLVKGTTNLRIVDAGVIPDAPNGNIHTTVTAVASRGVELIAQARQQQNGQADFT